MSLLDEYNFNNSITINYYIDYDYDEQIINLTLSSYDDKSNLLYEKITGTPFYDGTLDVVFNIDSINDRYVLLSNLKEELLILKFFSYC